jgi:CRP-like cAMP-binding protein
MVFPWGLVVTPKKTLSKPIGVPPAGRNETPNRLLAALPADEYRRLLPSLSIETLKFKQILQKRGEKVRAIYFPGGGVCSVTNVMEDGRLIEVATVGNEGMIGLTALSQDEPLGESMVQVPVPGMTAQVMTVAAFKQETDRRTPLYSIVQRWSYAFLAAVMQSVACNGLHSVEERCARWLLQTHDRVGKGSDDFLLTQEFLAVMLGARRPSVTIAVGTLQKAGLITYGHKKMAILNRTALEKVSCECYRAIKNQMEQVI